MILFSNITNTLTNNNNIYINKLLLVIRAVQMWKPCRKDWLLLYIEIDKVWKR